MPGQAPHPGELHHVELWVPDLDRAVAEWGWLLTELGYSAYQDWSAGRSWRLGATYLVVEQSPALTSAEHDRCRPGLNHLAFHADGRSRVDELAQAALDHGWTPLFAEKYPFAGGPGHYAAYLSNSDGFEVELVADADAGIVGGDRHDDGVNDQLPEACDRLAQIQAGVISRRQAVDGGMTLASVRWLAETGRWLALQRGVYSIYAGAPSRQAQLWAAVLRVSPGAVLSHETAAELHGLIDQPRSRIHVSIPQERVVAPIRGLVVHRSRTLARAAHPTDLPPRTKIEETVLDLVDQAVSFDAAFAITCAAVQRRLTTAVRIRRAMDTRSRLLWRTELALALADIASGVHSLLEYGYVRNVERPHGLPAAARQAEVVIDGRTRYVDNLYREFALCVELDGRQAHPDDRRWLDVRRDNANTVGRLGTLRYGWADVEPSAACSTATQVAQALWNRGWTGVLSRCGPACTAATSARPLPA